MSWDTCVNHVYNNTLEREGYGAKHYRRCKTRIMILVILWSSDHTSLMLTRFECIAFPPCFTARTIYTHFLRIEKLKLFSVATKLSFCSICWDQNILIKLRNFKKSRDLTGHVWLIYSRKTRTSGSAKVRFNNVFPQKETTFLSA